MLLLDKLFSKLFLTRKIKRDFPLDRLKGIDWHARMAAAKVYPPDENGECEFETEEGFDFSLVLPATQLIGGELPPSVFEILAQLNEIDNIFQNSMRIRARRDSAKNGKPLYDTLAMNPPDALYLNESWPPMIGYTAAKVNSELSIFLKKEGNRWLPFYDEALTRPL